MRYGSVCSGIEAVTVAWHGLGFEPVFFSETAEFPRRVLNYWWPGVPLHGDFQTIERDSYGAIDLLIGGIPCQDFSVAGLRAGLAGDRGQLIVSYAGLARRLGPRWLGFENVPGLLSADNGEAWGLFLAMLSGAPDGFIFRPAGDRWGNAGIIANYDANGYGLAYRVLDAQHSGIPQRRRRIYLVGYLGDWRPAAAVLFERESLGRDSAPRREPGQRVAAAAEAGPDFTQPDGPKVSATAPTLTGNHKGDGIGRHERLVAGTIGRGSGGRSPGLDASGAADNHLVTGPICHNGKAAGSATNQDAEMGLLVAYGGNNRSGPIDVAASLNAHPGGSGRMDFTVETFIAQTLRAEGFDASEDGSGRTNLVPVAFNARQDPVNTGDVTGSIDRYSTGQAVAFHQNTRGELREKETAGALTTGGGTPGQGYPAIREQMGVRRLTPLECERLQGFPDGHTLIPFKSYRIKITSSKAQRGRGVYKFRVIERVTFADDGPRYMALGNAMPVPDIRWLGHRIKLVDELVRQRGQSDDKNIA